jgi:subtilisin family serine protease
MTDATYVADALALVRLGPLMAMGTGSPEIGIGLVDGPVAIDHPDLAGSNIRAIGDDYVSSQPGIDASAHGTFVAGILVARRGSMAPAICPGCTLLVRPIFRDANADGAEATASVEDVADALVDCVNAGARIVNLSAATGEPTTRVVRGLRHALDHVARRGAIVVAAAGNQATLGSSEITRHPGVIPVVAYDLRGQPMRESNFGRSTGLWGLGAPGEMIVSLVPGGRSAARQSGTSFSTAFVTGTIALLWSQYPTADAARLRHAMSFGHRRTTVIPPLMDAEAAYRALADAR